MALPVIGSSFICKKYYILKLFTKIYLALSSIFTFSISIDFTACNVCQKDGTTQVYGSGKDVEYGFRGKLINRGWNAMYSVSLVYWQPNNLINPFNTYWRVVCQWNNRSILCIYHVVGYGKVLTNCTKRHFRESSRGVILVNVVEYIFNVERQG